MHTCTLAETIRIKISRIHGEKFKQLKQGETEPGTPECLLHCLGILTTTIPTLKPRAMKAHLHPALNTYVPEQS